MCKVCAAVGLGLVAAGLALAGPVKAADCAAEVTAAFEKQRKSKAFRMTALDQTPQGLVSMQVDYQPPDRMHQTVRHPSHPEPIETIAIGRWAWGTMGAGWEELQPQFAQAVTAHMREALVDPINQGGPFECLGTVAFEGKSYLAYRAGQRAADGAADGAAAAAPDRGPGAQPATTVPSLVRTVYVDPATGLPMLNVVSDTAAGSATVFKGVFAYPDDIRIEAPIGEPK